MLTRRNFLKLSAAAAGYVLMPGKGWVAVAQPPALLNGAAHPKFINPLPDALAPGFIFQPASGSNYQIGMYQVEQNLGLFDTATGQPLMTTVWGYGTGPGFPNATFPGRTFEVQSNQQITVDWTNNLVDGAGAPLPHMLPVDTTLHWASHDVNGDPTRDVPFVPHVHGGHTESDSDGLPEYWFTPGFEQVGPRWAKTKYVYDNSQQAGTVWYHDHALGITRLNVYAGLAGFYLIRDAVDTGKPDNPLGLPVYPYEVPIVIQDRQFTATGQLFYPSTDPMLPLGAPNPSALPEFFGDFILVNGVAWPFMDVEPRKYRFRLLNGSDSRFYNLWVNAGNEMLMTPEGNGPQIIQIGTELGLLPSPVFLDQLTIGPGERADFIIDFAGWEGQTLVVRNNARSPYPFGGTVNSRADGQIIAFRVGTIVNAPDNPIPVTLAGPIAPLVSNKPTRKLLLFEGTDSYGRLQPMLGVAEPTADVCGNLVNGTLLWDAPITENPQVGDTEIWEVYNTTADAHPIHLHLVQFQILGRQKFRWTTTAKSMTAHNGTTSTGAYLSNVSLIGKLKPPPANEAGWKDTAQMFPGEMTRIIAKFDRPGRYVWHCHILSHEDHEMMRPYHVGPGAESECPTQGFLILPLNLAVETTSMPEFTWQDISQGCYFIQIASDPDFANVVEDATVVEGQRYKAKGLRSGRYYWRVKVGGACDVEPSEWSEVRQVIVS